MQSQRRNRTRAPARKPPSQPPRRRLLVVCEGECTEPEYIRGFERWVRSAPVKVTIDPETGDPKHLVDTAKRLVAEADAAAKREEDAFLRFDEAWCVCDVDKHPRLPDARQMARDNGIKMAVSNPCVELWLLLHLRDSPGAQHHHKVQEMLKKFLPGYDKHLKFEDLAAGVDDATARARRLDEAADQDGESGRNPTTGFYRLTDSIRRG